MNFHDTHRHEIDAEAQRILHSIRNMIGAGGRKVLMNVLYAYLKDTTDAMKEGSSCKGKGCSFCCHDEILMSGLEAEHMKEVLKEAIPHKGRLEVQNLFSYEDLTFEQKKCSLLDDSGTCTIYDNRPLICRTHNSTDKVELCKEDENGNKQFHGQLMAVNVEAIQKALLLESRGYEPMHKVLNELNNK